MALPAPVNISPLIKFGRWTLLSAGIVYGVAKHAVLSPVENKRRELREARLREQEPILRKKKELELQEELRKLQQAIFPESTPPEQRDCKC